MSEFKQMIAAPINNLRDHNNNNHNSNSGKRKQTNNTNSSITTTAHDLEMEQMRRKGETALQHVRLLLSHMLLRRTQKDILRASLPPRLDVFLYCHMNELQQAQYNEVCRTMFGNLGVANRDIQTAMNLCRPPPTTNSTNSVSSSNISSGHNTNMPVDNRNNSSNNSNNSNSNNIDICSSDDEEAEEDNKSSSTTFKYSLVLPHLQQLRSICNFYNSNNNTNDDLDTSVPTTANNTSNSTSTNSKMTNSSTYNKLLNKNTANANSNANSSGNGLDITSLMKNSAKINVSVCMYGLLIEIWN